MSPILQPMILISLSSVLLIGLSVIPGVKGCLIVVMGKIKNRLQKKSIIIME
jgi:hypothetical protein